MTKMLLSFPWLWTAPQWPPFRLLKASVHFKHACRIVKQHLKHPTPGNLLYIFVSLRLCGIFIKPQDMRELVPLCANLFLSIDFVCNCASFKIRFRFCLTTQYYLSTHRGWCYVFFPSPVSTIETPLLARLSKYSLQPLWLAQTFAVISLTKFTYI